METVGSSKKASEQECKHVQSLFFGCIFITDAYGSLKINKQQTSDMYGNIHTTHSLTSNVKHTLACNKTLFDLLRCYSFWNIFIFITVTANPNIYIFFYWKVFLNSLIEETLSTIFYISS